VTSEDPTRPAERVPDHEKADGSGGRRWGHVARWIIVPLAVVPLVLLLSFGFGRDPSALTSPLIGKTAPSFTLTAIDGRRVSSTGLRGRPYVVNFWASWCIPACVEEHPIVIDAQRRYGSRVAIIGVLYQDSPDDALRFLARYGDGGWPQLIDEDGRLAIDYGVMGPPETYFVDTSGVVRAKQFGPLTTASMEADLALILGSNARH